MLPLYHLENPCVNYCAVQVFFRAFSRFMSNSKGYDLTLMTTDL